MSEVDYYYYYYTLSSSDEVSQILECLASNRRDDVEP